MKITVVMPADNEERDLPRLLERTREALGPWADYEVLIGTVPGPETNGG